MKLKKTKSLNNINFKESLGSVVHDSTDSIAMLEKSLPLLWTGNITVYGKMHPVTQKSFLEMISQKE